MRNDRSEQLTTLLDLLKDTLPALPGFRSLSIFGSLVEGRADEYSDLDLIVETDDLSGAKADLLGILERVGPVEFSWAIRLRPDEWNPTIVFRNRSHYHKLDLGLVDSNNANRTIPREQTVLLVEGGGDHKPSPVAPSAAYAPEHGSTGHFLLGMFLGGSRYVKARKRDQHMVCYRFASAASEWSARLLYASLTGDRSLSSKLSTVEYMKLDKLATEQDRLTLLNALDFSTPASLDRAMYLILSRQYEYARVIAEQTGENLPDAVFRRFLEFVGSELGVEK